MKRLRCLKWSILTCIIVLLAISITAFLSLTASASDKHKITIGDDRNYPPYSYIDKNGNPSGFNIEIARAVCKAMNYDVDFKLDEWSKVRKELETGKIDAISGMFYSKDREKLYSFSVRHYITNGNIFTRKGFNLKNLDDLRGKTVVVQKSDILEEYLRGLNLNIKFVETTTPVNAMKLVENREYDYTALMEQIGLYSIKAGKFKDIKQQNIVMSPKECAMAVKKGNDTLLMMLNGGLNVIKANGEYQKIYNKWLGIYEPKNLTDYIEEHKLVVLALLVLIVILFSNIVMLKLIVNKRTYELRNANNILEANRNELTDANQELEASMEQILAMEETLQSQYDNIAESQKKLLVSEEKNKAIINALPDTLFIIDCNGVLLDCHTNDESMLVMPISMQIGKKLDEILPYDIAFDINEKIKAAIEKGTAQRYEYELDINDSRTIFEMRIVKSKENEVVCITRNISLDVQYRERIEYLSYHDQLTGLYNRRFFEEEMKRLNVKRNLPLCILMGDVNGLKLVNDSFGHALGDKLLIKISDILRKACRSGEIISRIGGDEFVILIPRMDYTHAQALIERINTISRSEKVESIDISISFGLEVKYDENEDIYELLKNAEDHMYKKKLLEGPSVRSKSISTIIRALHEKNKREEQHSVRVAELCSKLAIEIGMSASEADIIKSVGLLHDIGKIAIDENIINSDKILTQDEFDEIKRHPEVGYRILRSVNDMHDMAEYVLYHHERWDGKGYPRGLSGEQIPLQSRIIGLAEAFDAITSDKSYKSRKPEDLAIDELRNNAGKQFDPQLVEKFIDRVIGRETRIKG